MTLYPELSRHSLEFLAVNISHHDSDGTHRKVTILFHFQFTVSISASKRQVPVSPRPRET
jgi:hypothetical protein